MHLLLKLALFYIIEDFGLYWVHRLMHTKQFWRTHKWHHYPTYIMYWLAGIRTSLPHLVLFNFTFVAARPLLGGSPGWIFPLIAIEHLCRNNWMHMNVSWKSTWLEWLIVTPRYHQIHHSITDFLSRFDFLGLALIVKLGLLIDQLRLDLVARVLLRAFDKALELADALPRHVSSSHTISSTTIASAGRCRNEDPRLVRISGGV